MPGMVEPKHEKPCSINIQLNETGEVDELKVPACSQIKGMSHVKSTCENENTRD